MLASSQIYQFLSANLPYLVIPFVSGFVGWFTNVIAIKMTFYPLNYTGIRPFGWQGIIPSKAKKMAGKAVDLMTNKLLNVKEVFSTVDPKIVAENIEPGMRTVSIQIVNEAMMAQMPVIWQQLPQNQKNKVYERIMEQLPTITVNMMADVKENINELIDLKKLAISAMIEDKALINRIFLNVGKREFRFIEISGWYFGFIFGIPQMILTYFYNPWWMMPLAGLIVGYATNWLALKLIFEPVKPIRIFGMQIQGLFLKRQTEVAAEYSAMITSRILTTENIFDAIYRNPSTRKIHELVRKYVNIITEQMISGEIELVKSLFSKKKLDYVKNIAFYRLMQEIPVIMRSTFVYAESALDLQRLMREKMTGLPSNEFVGFLRPVFQEDEMKLILVGAVLGLIAGFVQFSVSF